MMDKIIYRVVVLLLIATFTLSKSIYHFNKAYKNSNYYKKKNK